MLPPAIRRMRQHFFPALVLSLLIVLTLGCGSGSAHTEPAQTAFPAATVPLTKLSSDPYTNSTSQHATEVEPDTFAFGSTIVTAFQVGRIHGGGASDIGFATSTNAGDADKNWIVCDNNSTSQFYGHCYIEWDDVNSGDLIKMNTSADGGLTWESALNTADGAHGIGGQPLVQPGGKVIVPIAGGVFGSMLAFSSSDGGASWSSAVTVSSITDHTEAGHLRSGPLPSAEIDANGTVYVVWADCRFRTNCSSNDLVLSTSADGVTWTKPARIPIDPTTRTVDHFIPGLAVDPATSGSSAHLTLTYYYYLISNCATVCQMGVAFVSSQDGGQTWSAPVELAGPMSTSWLPNTFSGLMVADYISTSYVNGNAFAVFAAAKAPSGSTLDEAMYTTT